MLSIFKRVNAYSTVAKDDWKKVFLIFTVTYAAWYAIDT